MAKEWIVNGRFIFNGHAMVEAETAEEAKAKFDSGDFEFDVNTAELCDYESRGKVAEA